MSEQNFKKEDEMFELNGVVYKNEKQYFFWKQLLDKLEEKKNSRDPKESIWDNPIM
jgi:hypothetical protein